MFSFHKPKIYRSILGCCICRAKSSSSRFTDSKKYESEFEKCFRLKNEKRSGEICNACVLLVKRWKKLPTGTNKNWHHVVDARAGPGTKSFKSSSKSSSNNDDKRRHRRQRRLLSSSNVNNNGTTTNKSSKTTNNNNSTGGKCKYFFSVNVIHIARQSTLILAQQHLYHHYHHYDNFIISNSLDFKRVKNLP